MNPYPGDLHLPPYNLDSSNCCTSSYLGSDNNLSYNQDQKNTSHTLLSKIGKRVDPRLLGLLESFGEIYDDRREFVHGIFHADHEEVFKKIGDALKKKKKQMKKSGSMKRSTSMRVMRGRGIEDESGFDGRLERFKVRAPKVIVAGENDGSGDQATKGSDGSK